MTTTLMLSYSSAWGSSFATSWRPLCTKLYSSKCFISKKVSSQYQNHPNIFYIKIAEGFTNLDMATLFQIKCYNKKMV